MDDSTTPTGPTPPETPGSSPSPYGPAVGGPTRGGGARRVGSAIGGAVKGKVTGTGAASGAAKAAGSSANGEPTSAGEQAIGDAADIAKAALKGAAIGGAAGAIRGAALGAVKSKTGKKVLAGVALMLVLIIGIAVNVVTSVLPQQQQAATAGANEIANKAVVAKVITNDTTAALVNSVADNNAVPYTMLAAIYQMQSVNSRKTGPLGISLAAADGRISKDDAKDLTKALKFIANDLSVGLQNGLKCLASKNVDIGFLESTDADGKRKRVLDTSEASGEARAESKDAYVAVLKTLPLTKISTSAESIYNLAFAWATGKECKALPDDNYGAAVSTQTEITLNDTQKGYAEAIVKKSEDLDLDRQAAIIAIMTALQESTLRMYWNPKVPGSEELAPQAADKGEDTGIPSACSSSR